MTMRMTELSIRSPALMEGCGPRNQGCREKIGRVTAIATLLELRTNISLPPRGPYDSSCDSRRANWK